jgi:hypothetical protein
MHHKRNSIIVGGICLVWMAGLLAGYYLYHKPFDPSFALAFVRLIWTILPAAWILFLAGGLGYRINRLDNLPPVERSFLQVGIGLGVFSILILIAGLTIGHLSLVLWLLAVLPAPFLYRSGLSWGRQLSASRQLFAGTDGFTRWIIGLSIFICICSLLIALAPPTHYDALTYHLALPGQYLQSGTIHTADSWLRSGNLQTGEMLYTWAMNFGVDSSAAVLGWTVCLLALLALVNFIHRHLDLRSAWVGAAAVLAGSSVAAAMGWAYIDWFCFAFGLAALICLVEWREIGYRRYLFLCGIFSGLSFASKYTGAVILVGIAIVVFYTMMRREKPAYRHIGLLIAGFLIPAIPWLLKNLIITGNPLAPYLIASGNIPAARQQGLQSSVPFGNWMDILLLPIRATLIGAEGGEGYSHTIGVLFLLLGPLALIPAAHSPASARWRTSVVVISISTLVVWVVANRYSGLLVQSRMYYAAFPAFACLAAAGFYALDRLEIPQVRLGRIGAALILLALSLNVIEIGRSLISSRAVPFLAGVISKQDYLEQNLGEYARTANDIRSSGYKTLLVYEPRGYYCQPGCTQDEILDRWSYDFHRLGTCPAVLADWQAQGFTQVLAYQSGIDFFLKANDPHHQTADLISLQTCLNTLQETKDYSGMYKLFQLNK